MKIVFYDPLEELKALIESCEKEIVDPRYTEPKPPIVPDFIKDAEGYVDTWKAPPPKMIKVPKEGVRFISLSKLDMRACISHLNASDIFPEFINARANRLNQYKTRLNELNIKINEYADDAPVDGTRQALFDQQDDLELIIEKTKEEIPQELELPSGLRVRVSLTA